MDLDLTTVVQMAAIAGSMYTRPLRSMVRRRPIVPSVSDSVEFGTNKVRCRVGLWSAGSRLSVVVAFRGSSNGAEWANNAHLGMWQSMTPIVSGKVHPGFIRSLDDIWSEVEPAILSLTQKHLPELMAAYASGKSVPICIVGHSRGGALAVLAGLRSLRTFLLPVHVYTFGAPRVGDSDFAAAFEEAFTAGDSIHWRFECQGDPVPVFPFALQATHTGRLAYLPTRSETVDLLGAEPHSGLRALRSLSAKPTRNHSMITYMDRLRSTSGVRLRIKR